MRLFFFSILTLTSTVVGFTFEHSLRAANGMKTAYVICAEDGAKNKVSRDLTKEDKVLCIRGHELTRIICPKDKMVNRLRNAEGGLNTQCSKDGASLITLPQDSGPDKIKESVLESYPRAMRSRYKLFAEKCSKCHSLARAINAPFNAADWQRYVKRMVRRPSSGINKDQGKEIYRFLRFYSQQEIELLTTP